MAYLLDTHTFLWWIFNKQTQLGQSAKDIISSEEEIYLSLVSVWEIALKVSIGKLQIRKSPQEFIKENVEKNAFNFLEIKLDHIIQSTQLPFYHRDPFDRLLISQSSIEGMTIISADEVFDKYLIKRIW